MYIRAIKKAPNPKNGVVYTTHQLVESHRTEKGPRQRTIMHLEALTLPQMRWRERGYYRFDVATAHAFAALDSAPRVTPTHAKLATC